MFRFQSHDDTLLAGVIALVAAIWFLSLTYRSAEHPDVPSPTPTPAPASVSLWIVSAPWCGPCKQMKPVIDKLVAEGLSIRVIDADSSEGKSLRSELGINGCPAIVQVIRRGPLGESVQKTLLQVGKAGEAQLRQWLSEPRESLVTGARTENSFSPPGSPPE